MAEKPGFQTGTVIEVRQTNDDQPRCIGIAEQEYTMLSGKSQTKYLFLNFLFITITQVDYSFIFTEKN